MTCQHCQTWILDDDHRCRRCGRRVRNTPSRISPNTYPIAATATARAYEPEEDGAPATARPENFHSAPATPEGQQQLFSMSAFEPRVIPFDSLTTQAERESIRARVAERPRPAPVRAAKVEVRRARGRKTRSADARSSNQWRLDLETQAEAFSPPLSTIICDAPVAPAGLRVEAAVIDTLLILAGCAFGAVLFAWEGGRLSLDRHVLPFFGMALMTLPLFYKLLWTFVGRDTAGMRCAGLRLVDFDGNPPSQSRRYQRLFGSILSLLAGGIGLVWSLIDEDGLTWHDHISSTFPTLAAEN